VGTGQEDPAVFAPRSLECLQWVRVCAEAGLRGIVITAKHHDGFCLWPTATTEHCIRNSPWRNGQADLLKELANACKAYDLRLGVYLSPWDRNASCYGTAEYNDFYLAQLREVLSGYGPLFEVWFDGAGGEGPDGRRQDYDWPAFFALVAELQPGAVIFSDAGPGLRWVGNEAGVAGETNWCLLRWQEFAPGHARPAELMTGHEDGTAWVPAEADVSIRPGWFWHPEEDDRTKSIDELLDIWYSSVGRNALLLLNVPVDRRGLVPEADAERLRTWRKILDATFHRNLTRGARATASNVRGGARRFAAARALDGRPDTYWATDDGVTSAELRLELPRPVLANRILLREHVALGQRVRAFRVEVREDGTWRLLARGTTIGMKRVFRVPVVRVEALRVVVEDARACPPLAEVGLHAAPPRVRIEPPGAVFLERGRGELTADFPDAEIHYRLDGQEPGLADPLYREPLELTADARLVARAFRQGRSESLSSRAEFRVLEEEDLVRGVRPMPGLQPGLAWRALEGAVDKVADLARARVVARGHCRAPDPALRTRSEDAGLIFEGFLEVPADGLYTFALRCDDGSVLWVAGRRVVDADGLHGLEEHRGQSGLRAGLHPLRLAWFNHTGDAGLELLWQPPGSEALVPVPPERFRRRPD